jgi:hypothetical protein
MAKVLSNKGSAKGGMFGKGGNGHMVGKTGAAPRNAGDTAGVKSMGPKWAGGGSASMAPNRGSQPAKGGSTSAY